jgi:hypothetical protein
MLNGWPPTNDPILSRLNAWHAPGNTDLSLIAEMIDFQPLSAIRIVGIMLACYQVFLF